MTSRRTVLQQLAAVSGSVGLSGCAQFLAGRAETPPADLPPNPRAATLPTRQHAWSATLRRDGDGNRLAPRHHRILLLDLSVEPSTDAARTVERAMRTLEAAHDWGPSGLLHTLAWGSAYFDRLDRLSESPIRRPQVLSRTDEPDLQAFDAALVLASDVPSHLSAADAAMFGDRDELGGAAVDDRLGTVFDVAGRRTGFTGAGLPAAHADAEGVPDAIPEDAPMFTGFFSGRSKTQASEDRVTIADGPYAGGTTMHLSRIRESLADWWGLDDADRIARMFSPGTTADEVEGLTDAVPLGDDPRDDASDHGVVGHFQKVARARKDGEPVLLRRDFNTVDGGEPGLHFLSFQRTLAEFERARRAMNGWYLRDDHPDITDRENNGLLDFITVTARANFYVPPRDRRAFPP